MIHYQGGVPNPSMLNTQQRIAAQIPEAVLDLSTKLLMADVRAKFGVCRTTAGEAVHTAKVWRGLRRRFANG